MAGKVEIKNVKEYETENNYLLWWSDKRHFPQHEKLNLRVRKDGVKNT